MRSKNYENKRNCFCRTAYFKLFAECTSQIVLSKSGYDPDFRARRISIDVESIIGRISCWQHLVINTNFNVQKIWRHRQVFARDLVMNGVVDMNAHK